MSDSPTTTTPVPRRSQRDKKSVNYFAAEASTSTNRKRKRQGSDTENDATGVTDGEDAHEHGQDDDDDDDADDADAPKSKATRKGKAKVSPKSKGAPAAKKPRTNKGQPKTMGRRGRKAKEGDDAYDAAQVAKDTKISADNPLFNAIMNPAAALQSTAEDFLESLEQSPAAAQAELINLVLRACGCNDTLNADEALDYDGVVDSLDNFTESLKQDNSPVYPLTSKLPVFKKFRKSLSEFIERLIASSAELGALYSSDMMATLQAWVIAMSSSQIRSFRHTATVVALEVETALCDVAAAVEKEAEVVGRQREGEKKRKSGKKGGNARDKELEGKAQEIRERRTKLAEFLKEFVDGVFVHRYRDLDPNIRAECVRAIGLWFRKYPGHFLDASYLRYVGWVLSDSHTLVRVEAVKALAGVYDQADYIASLSHFTERFKPRLLEMATSDTELSVRVAVIQVLGSLDSHSLLEEEEREKLCLLVFDEEPKVRRAVSQFVRGVWEEVVEERLVGRGKPSVEDTTRAGVKALASLLVKWGKVLDKLVDEEEEGSDGGGPEGGEGVNGTSRRGNRRKEVVALVGAEQQGRIALAVEALWDEVEPISDWEGLLDLLLLDHSAVGGEEGNDDGRPTPRARANGKKSADEVVVDSIWRLEEVEESVLLQVLVAALRRAKAESSGAKKGEEENVTNDITRALIKGLPRLFIKHQTDRNRIAEVLLMPTLMNLDLYLEMRMIAAYSSLWDDVIKQFTSHSSVTVLSHAMASIRHFMDATSLSNTNSTKILELEDELSSSLRDTVAGREEIEVATFSEDEVLALTAFCTRLTVLAGTRNMTAWIEEDEGGKQSSAWDILSALVERGRLGYKEEETMIEQALHVLTLHIIWKSKGLTVDNDPTPEEVRYKETLVEERDTLLEKLVEYAVGTQSNTVEGVKRAAFKHLLDLHVLFSDAQSLAADGSPLPLASVALSLDDEIQYRCAGYVQAEIERYAEFLEGQEEGEEDGGDGSAGSSDEEGGGGEKVGNKEKVKKVKKPRTEENKGFQALLEQEYLFIDVMSTFLRAIRAGAVNVQHGAIVLAHYGRLGLAFDTCSKVIVEILREEGMMKDNAEIVITVVTQALQEAYTLVLDGVVHDESNAIHLAKLLSSSFAIRGSQLSIVRRLDSQYIVQIHTQLLNWIGRKLAAYENNKNKKGLKTAVMFFKVMVPLFSVIQSRDALKIKAHMDQILAQAKVEVSPSSKAWEPQRAYEKRLSAIMSKEKRSKSKKTGKGVKSAAAITSDEEGSEGEHADEVSPPRPKPKSRRPTRANPDPSPDRDADNDELEPEPVTPKPKPKPRPIRPTINKQKSQSPQKLPSSATSKTPVRSRSPTMSTPAASDTEDNDIPIPAAVTPTPSNSRKRPRADDEEELGSIPNGVTTGDDAPSEEEEGTPEIQVRRKRVRH